MKGVVGAVTLLIGLGLVLRFGGSSNALAQTLGWNINQGLSTLTLSGFGGNNPPGVG